MHIIKFSDSSGDTQIIESIESGIIKNGNSR